MGHRKKEAPRRGSLGLRPRKRAARIVPRVRRWPEVSVPKPVLLGFMGYKAGMTHAIIVDDRPNSMTYGREVFAPLTVVEAPPMIVLAVRGYTIDQGRLVTAGDVWRSPLESLVKLAEEYSERIIVNRDANEIVRGYLKGLRKKLPSLVKEEANGRYGYKFIEGNWERDLEQLLSMNLADLRVIASTIPILTGIGKKAPDILEVRIGGGSIDDRVKYAKEIIGGYVTVRDTLMYTKYVDVIAVTKGKGFQGVVKRFGVKELPRWHKHRKGSRKVASRSPAMGTISPVPQAGQTGFHRRTDYNKRIIAIGDNGLEITPSGGFPGYGLVRTQYVVLYGTLPGPRKRQLILRYPIRPPTWIPEDYPRIVYLSLSSKVSG
ncbi:MAG: 50S ribosomal protein L3 [Desulfurococcaceae archaeon]